MTTVLVTGGAGYIGSHICYELIAKDYQVIAADSCINAISGNGINKPPSIRRVEQLTNKTIEFYKTSTLEENNLREIFQLHKINVVIHLAALKAVGESVSHPLEYYSNNIIGTITLIKVMKDYGVKRLIFSSSATVYGTPQYLPIDEQHLTGINLTNPYGQTKYMSEQILKDICHSDDKWQVIFLRYFNPVGAHESGKIGEDPRGIPNNLVPYISQVAIGKRPYLSVFGNDYETKDGTGVRDYIHVVDLAKGHVDSLKWLLNNSLSGWKAINLGTGVGISVLEMIKAFTSACGRNIPYKFVDRRPGDVSTVVASCSLAEILLGWRATKTLQDMCEDTWRWQQMNPEGYSGP